MERNLVCSNIIAGEDLSDAEYLLVGFDGKKTAADGDVPYGVIKTGADQDQPIAVVTGGEFWVTVGESVAAGDALTGGANGKANKADIDATYGLMQVPFGVAMEAGDADSIVRVLIR